MSLHGTIEVNGHVIGRWSARRVRTSPIWNLYEWHAEQYEAMGVDQHGAWKGRLIHRSSDGALVLASKVLAAASRARRHRE